MRREWSKESRYILLALVIAFVILGLWYIRELFKPLIIGGLIAYILMPAVSLLMHRFRKLSHSAAVNLVFFTGLLIALAIPATLIPALSDEFNSIVTDLVRIPATLDAAMQKPIMIAGFSVYLHPYLPNLSQSFRNYLTALPQNLFSVLEATGRNFAWLLVILVSSYHFLKDWDKLRRWISLLPPRKYYWDGVHIYMQIKKVWSSYLRGTLALMLIVGVVFTIVYLVIGLPGALIIGFLAGLLSLIPEIGPFASAMIAAFVGLVEGSYFLPISNFWFAVLILGIYVVLINLKGIWLRPRIMGRSVHLHEGLVFVAIMAAVIFQGILGALIVVPVIASGVVVARYIRRRILGQQPFAARVIDPAVEGKSQRKTRHPKLKLKSDGEEI